MPKQIIIAEQHHIAAVFSEDQIQELVVATGHHQIGDIYLGVVENVLPGIDAAFVNIGDSERNGFIHVTDLGPLKLKRTSGAITELLTPQQKVLVQVMKEPTGNKGPRLTGNVSLPGRYVVLMPYGRGVNLSRRIKSESDRNRLRALAILIKPAGMGILVRTEAEGKPEDSIIEDLEALQKQWEDIQKEAQTTRAPALLNRDNDFIQRVLRDMYGGDVNRIVVDSSTGLKRVKQYLLSWSGGQTPQGVMIDHHRDRIPVLEYFRVNAAIREALKPRVDLPSGGYVIIEPTEALTVIDVNSGSFTRSATARETVLWTNCEAATEIARQLRLRNLAGVIIVDLIDMEDRKDQLQVIEHFNKVLKTDKARPQIAQLSELGLVELTRKRQGQNIYELFGRPCSTCGGLGHLVHLPGEAEREREVLGTQRERVLPTVGDIERSSLPIKEYRTPTPRSESRETVYDVPGETASADYDNDLSLLNHPSYQTLGDVNKNRRTRRRRINRTGELAVKEDRMPTTNPRFGAETFSEDAELEPTVTSEVVPSTNKNGWVEKTERTKPIKPEPVKPVVEPPEIVNVEMTPEEQEVYALMGISPLVHLNRQVKKSKPVIIHITEPGQLPVSNISDDDNVSELTNDNNTLSEPIVESTIEEPIDLLYASESFPIVLEAPKVEIMNGGEAENSAENNAESNAENNDGVTYSSRRRRRRSSAMEDSTTTE